MLLTQQRVASCERSEIQWCAEVIRSFYTSYLRIYISEQLVLPPLTKLGVRRGVFT
jgi:hypothetical protein